MPNKAWQVLFIPAGKEAGSQKHQLLAGILRSPLGWWYQIKKHTGFVLIFQDCKIWNIWNHSTCFFLPVFSFKKYIYKPKILVIKNKILKKNPDSRVLILLKSAMAFEIGKRYQTRLSASWLAKASQWYIAVVRTTFLYLRQFTP